MPALTWGAVLSVLPQLRAVLEERREAPLSRPAGIHPDVIARMRAARVGEAIISRVVRLNPQIQEGDRMRGIHFKATCRREVFRDAVTRAQFEAQWGRGSWRQIPKGRLLNAGGRRRWVPYSVFMEGPAS